MFRNKYDHMIDKYRHRFLHDRFKKLNVARGDAPYLFKMFKVKQIKMNDLISDFPFHKSHATRSINHLVEDGFLLKEVDPDDKRGYIITLTEKGIGIGKSVEKTFADWEELVTSVMTEEEMETIRRITEKIYFKLREYYKEDLLDEETEKK